jgi:hypothetical protein
MGASNANSETRVELCVRSLLPSGDRSHQRATIRRLDRLAAADVVDDVSVCVWGRGVDLDGETAGTDAARAIHRRVEAFEAWADDAGASLEPYLDRTEISSQITGESCTALRFPKLMLAVYRDDDLVYVAPHADATSRCTVGDALDALERDDDDLLQGGPATRFRPPAGTLTTTDSRP